jgi:hypothetical protein
MYIFLVTILGVKIEKLFGGHFSAKSSKKYLVTIFSVKILQNIFDDHFSVKK